MFLLDRYLFAGFGVQAVFTSPVVDSNGSTVAFLSVSAPSALAAAARAQDLGIPHELLSKASADIPPSCINLKDDDGCAPGSSNEQYTAAEIRTQGYATGWSKAGNSKVCLRCFKT